jgi:hypothetical protein
MIIELNTPIIRGDKTITQLELREPTIGECMTAYPLLNSTEADAMAKFEIALIASVTGLPAICIEGVAVRKLNAAVKFIRTFPIGLPLQGNVEIDENIESMIVPVTASLGNETISEVLIREPTAKQRTNALREMSSGGVDEKGAKMVMNLLVATTGKSKPLLSSMSISDFIKCAEVISCFLGASQQTTEN